MAELPDIKFNKLGSFQLVDLIMINSGSNTYVLGSEININDVNDINIEFKHNGKTIFTETSNTVMADQYESLKWLIKQLLNHGYELKKGDLLLTGAIGKMYPAKRGRYVLNYGDKTSLLFELR